MSIERVVLLNFLDIKVNPNSLSFSQGERERESRRSPVVMGMVRWCDGAMVLGNFHCLGIPLFRIIVGQGPMALAVGAGGDVVTFFLSSIFFSFLSSSLGDGPL